MAQNSGPFHRGPTRASATTRRSPGSREPSPRSARGGIGLTPAIIGGQAVGPSLPVVVRSGSIPATQSSYTGFTRTGMFTGYGVGGNIAYGAPEIRNPLLSTSNFQLPQTSLELNQWIRYFDRFHPLVGNAIDMHATVPFGRFELRGIVDPYIQEFYEDMADRMNLLSFIFEISREFELMGEAWPFGIWDEQMQCWEDAIVLNPDYVECHGVMIGGTKGHRYELVLDHETRQFLMSADPLDQELIADIDPVIRQSAQTGLNMPLDPFNTTHLARRASPYDARGTSIVLGCLKDLMYEEQLREAQFKIAGGISRPREIWKLGSQGEWIPTDQDLDDLRANVEAMRNDPNGVIFSHYGIAVDMIGAERRILPLGPEMDVLEKRILSRLYTSKAATHGEGPTFSNATVAMQILDARYAWKRDFVLNYLKRKLFLPVALVNQFREPLSQAEFSHNVRTRSLIERPPILPELNFLTKVNLKDSQQQVSYLMTLYQGSGLPLKLLCDALQVDYGECMAWLKREKGTLVDPAVTAAWKARQTALAAQPAASPSAGMPRQLPAPGAPSQAEKAVEEVLDDAEDDFDAGVQDARSEERANAPKSPKPGTPASETTASLTPRDIVLSSRLVRNTMKGREGSNGRSSIGFNHRGRRGDR